MFDVMGSAVLRKKFGGKTRTDVALRLRVQRTKRTQDSTSIQTARYWLSAYCSLIIRSVAARHGPSLCWHMKICKGVEDTEIQ